MNIEIKDPCPHCQLPLAVFDITYKTDGTKIYLHNHCHTEIKREMGKIIIEQIECFACKNIGKKRIYDTSHYFFKCAKCKGYEFGIYNGDGRSGGGVDFSKRVGDVISPIDVEWNANKD
jgi:hypothetical protein